MKLVWTSEALHTLEINFLAPSSIGQYPIWAHSFRSHQDSVGAPCNMVVMVKRGACLPFISATAAESSYGTNSREGREKDMYVQSPKIWLVRGLVKFVPAR